MSKPIRKRVSRKKAKNIDVDITSLLDILTILLVFLIQNFNASGIVINVPKGVTLPRSETKSLSHAGVVIQVSTSKIWVDDEEVLDTEKLPPAVYDQGGNRIIPLFNKLVAVKNAIKQVEKSTPEAKKFSGLANLVVDKTLKYSYLKKVMYTCAEAGFKTYKFVVMGGKK
ncbi:MAG: biopolymer transporter ExbD [Bacteriovoracaceae bacterium]|nr:biopolymer transporter ExbD [Bacteriovoracaceae bacterium]